MCSQSFTKPELSNCLSSIFGFSGFRPNQAEIINAILDQRDVFAVMPTGGGKSLCYQIPAHLLEGTCLVVSPLISLMKDQVDAAVEVGLNAAFLNSSLSDDEKNKVMGELIAGNLDLLYVAPERFAMKSFLKILQDVHVSFAAIDEAHCISEWGHDFRPDYLMLSLIAENFPDIPVAAFTATATNRVQDDIISRLKLRSPFTVRASFDRGNLFYKVIPRINANTQILHFLQKHTNESGIIYRTTRKSVESTAAFLKKNGISALPYHAGLSDYERIHNQEAFNKDEINVVVATIAFGMGIDKSNVRFVLHADLPKNMESYYQETGRAGRDGDPAECLLLFSRGDIPKIRYFIDQMEDEWEREKSLNNLNIMATFASVNSCRRHRILAYFDEVYPKKNCETCDVCTGDIEQVDATIDAQKVLSAIVRTGERFGSGHIIDIVTGADTQKIRSLGHDKLITYGVGKDKQKNYWRSIIDDLLAQNFVVRSDGQYPVLKLCGTCVKILKSEVKFFTLLKKEKPKKTIRAKFSADYDIGLFEKLRALRMEIARKKGVPPFVVFSDKTLREMASSCPVTETEMLKINGVGYKKLEKYGEKFLSIIIDFQQTK
ncbi:MAG: DNA helicase RecQ [Fibrobacteria bacterium]|nr:DNA helicase RecQ [Fibrobacteria bacterium]